MPRRTDIRSILILGSGPIVIGQACEFDYSGTQACKALKEENYRVILINSNPATIMTDTVMADATYIDALEWRTIAQVIKHERPDALLPTMGGQTALNCALDLVREEILEKYDVELIGACKEAIDKAEDREKFREAMHRIGLKTPRSGIAHSLTEARQVQAAIGFPCVIRPSFTMGGTGGGIAYNQEEFTEICSRGLDLSPTSELLIDESLLGWKECEMEVIRDRLDNCIVVCSIENIDPMGVHTGDSITVAPVQTLTDKEYQVMRNASIAVLREIGVETGGSNVQFAINPQTGELMVIEMNPRVSRSSALASKATGFPIAKVAAKLAVGYTLDELHNDITRTTPASFEPALDYVVVKVPRFAFEKFPDTDPRLTTQMKSVGETMAIGRTFQAALQKALRSLETGISGLDPIVTAGSDESRTVITRHLKTPGPERIRYAADALRHGMTVDQIAILTNIDPWFIAQLQDLASEERGLSEYSLDNIDLATMRRLKRKGFSDQTLAVLLDTTETAVRQWRWDRKLHPVYKRVDTCAAEFASTTAYLYSTYEEECESRPDKAHKIMVLGSGPNRIGQGIEFDYCCVHASLAIRDAGHESIMINCNPETVSTDYDTSDKLYFEPVTLEDVLEIVRIEEPAGVVVQFGGQTPLKLARDLTAAKVPIIGTPADAIDRTEDRRRFQKLLTKLGLRQPENALVFSPEEALAAARQLGYPLMVRPSYVLGGRAMELVHSDAQLQRYIHDAMRASGNFAVLLDRFLDQAIEVDVDLVSDGQQVVVGGIMEHIEQAGVHSGDSSCSLPPYSLTMKIQDEIRTLVKKLTLELGVVGLMNVQLAVQKDQIHILEVNPRAARTVPFVSKSIGVPLARIALLCMLKKPLAAQGYTREIIPPYVCVKESVFPFTKFPGADPILGPEMKSTGEVMSTGDNFAKAFARSIVAIGQSIPTQGNAFISVRDSDKPSIPEIAQQLHGLGFKLLVTEGTAKSIHNAQGPPCLVINKVNETQPNAIDYLKNNEIDLIVITTEGQQSIKDSTSIRRLALEHRVYYTTTIAGALALCMAMKDGNGTEPDVHSMQSLYTLINTEEASCLPR